MKKPRNVFIFHFHAAELTTHVMHLASSQRNPLQTFPQLPQLLFDFEGAGSVFWGEGRVRERKRAVVAAGPALEKMKNKKNPEASLT